jgi:hypothetical protein
MKQRVSFSGILRGQRFEATCTVFATQVTVPRTRIVRHTDYSIENVSLELPNGRYELLANGESILVIRSSGSWITAGSQ